VKLWVTEYVLTYDGRPSYTVSIMEFLDGKVARETQYFGDPFEPGPSRGAMGRANTPKSGRHKDGHPPLARVELPIDTIGRRETANGLWQRSGRCGRGLLKPCANGFRSIDMTVSAQALSSLAADTVPQTIIAGYRGYTLHEPKT